jgi:hypothetical protein
LSKPAESDLRLPAIRKGDAYVNSSSISNAGPNRDVLFASPREGRPQSVAIRQRARWPRGVAVSLSSSLFSNEANVGVAYLDLTKPDIELMSVCGPADVKRTVQLDEMNTTVRILSDDKGCRTKESRGRSRSESANRAAHRGQGHLCGRVGAERQQRHQPGQAICNLSGAGRSDGSVRQNLLATFRDTAKRLTALRNWRSHDGRDCDTDAAPYQALKDGPSSGQWFIPTRDILTGTKLDGNKAHDDNLYADRDRGALKSSFTTSAGNADDLDYSQWYWACLQHRADASFVWCGSFADGSDY